MVCRFTQEDLRNGKDQAQPDSHATQRPCWSERWSAVHAGREGTSSALCLWIGQNEAGLSLILNLQVSAQKITYRISDTPELSVLD
jgi:hypothetical protein